MIEEATERGRSIVAEARDARERMLADLAERRTASRRQLEALRAGRERLLEAFATARQSFDTLTDELTDSLPAAREAAERAAAEVEPGDEDPDALADELGLEDLSELDDVPAAAPAAAAEEATEAETTAGDEPEADAPEVASTAEAHAEGDAAVDEAAEETEAEQPISLEAVEPSEPEPESAEAPEVAVESSAASHLRLVQGGGSDDDHHDEDDDLHDDAVATADVDPASGAAEAIFARLRADADEHDEPAEGSDEPGASDDLAARGVEPVPFPEQGPSEGGVVVALNGGDVAVLEAAPEAVDDARWLDRRDEVLTPLERAVTRRVKRTLTDHENTVRDAVRRHKKGSVPTSIVGTVAELREAVVSAVLGDVAEVVVAGANFHDAETHGIDVDGPAVAELVLTEAVGPVVDPLHARLVAAVDQHTSGDSIDELDAALRSAFREWRNDQVPELSGDLVTAAFNEGILRSAQPGTAHCWVIDDGGVPNPDAEDNRLADAVPAGEPFPTGDLRPPAHAGCRCLLVPAPR